MNADPSEQPALSRARVAFLVAARAGNALFFILTATYCLLTYSSFAYQQFIRPHLVSSLTSFVIWHHLWHWVALGVTALTLVPELGRGRGRSLAWTYLASMTVLGVVLLFRPILPEVENDGLGLRLAFLFLVPPLWLALYDHLATAQRFAPTATDDRRIVVSGLAAAVAVWLMHLAAAPFRFDDLGDLPLSRTALLFGTATSLIVHLGMFAAATVLLIVALRVVVRARDRGPAEYGLIALLSMLGATLVAGNLVFSALSFHGVPAWLLAAEVGAVLTTVWSGMARRIAAGSETSVSALDAWLCPILGSTSRPMALAMLFVLPVAAFLVAERAARMDWDFLVQNLCLLGVWLLTFAYLHGAIRVPPGRWHAFPMTLAAALLVPIGVRGPVESELAAGLTRRSLVPELVLDGYAAVDPSYRLLRRFLSVEPPGSAGFYNMLRANSLIQHVVVAPIDVDFVKPLQRAPVRPPHIFLFVIDSLRRDYVAPYNPEVSFTPSIARFASESDVYTRAFTPYGGTGLSMPALWVGGLLLHKQYVVPFERLNTLEKLLRANEYRSLVSMDHITAQLVGPDPRRQELDHGRNELDYDLCGTLGELQSQLARPGAGETPVFAHTRSLNLHVSKLVTGGLRSSPGHEGFQALAVASIARMDRCFGGFIDFLKGQGLYDDSVVILTADHGDSLGEAGRWGHSMTIFPEILRIPLIVHAPPRLRNGLTSDHDAVSFVTDVTPTLYALLGYEPQSPGWAYGASLLVPPGTDQSWRRRQSFLVASSYGPVYGLVEQNGEALYIADGVNRRDSAYVLSSLRPVRVGVTDARRASSRELIRQRVAGLAEMYDFTPQP